MLHSSIIIDIRQLVKHNNTSMPLTKDEIKEIAIRAADGVIERAYTKSTFNPHTPSGALSDPPAVELLGVARRPPRPGEALEREEEKMERRRRGLQPGAYRRPPLEWEQIERIQELKASGLKFSEIADRLKLPMTTVWKAYHRGRPPLIREITTQRIQEVRDLRRQGLTLEQIGYRIGKTKQHVLYLLHRAGEMVNVAKAAEDLQDRMLRVSDILATPDTVPQLTEAADKLQDISEDAALLLEITHKIPLLPEYFPSHPFQIGFRASWAEEVLRTGAWCLEQKQKSYDIVDIPRLGERKVPHTSEHKELLKTCGGSAADAAAGYLQNKPGYETKMAQHVAIVEEMMEEVKE